MLRALWLIVLCSTAPLITAPPTIPRTVIGANLVYSPVHRKVLLVNGSEDFKTEIDTRVWSWDGRRWAPLDGTGPRVRNMAGAAFDSARDELVFFGGVRPREALDEMWGWKNGTWRRIVATEVGPRDHHVMAYDTHRARVVLFGGSGRRPEGAERRLSPEDTWEWDGTRWSQQATVGPPGRGRSAMVYDEKRREMVLFGGGGNQMLGDTWLWNGTAWREVGGDGPPARYAHAMAYDSHRSVVVLYGGSSAYRPAQYLTDMWEWNGSRWRAVPVPEVNPGIRYSPGMAYDRHRRRIVLQGGIQPSPGGASHYVFDTWEWDGRRWTAASVN
jgi:hypothetical protein